MRPCSSGAGFGLRGSSLYGRRSAAASSSVLRPCSAARLAQLRQHRLVQPRHPSTRPSPPPRSQRHHCGDIYHVMPPQAPARQLPANRCLVAGHGRASILTEDGELATGTPAEITRPARRRDARCWCTPPSRSAAWACARAPCVRPAGTVGVRPPGLPRRADAPRARLGAGHAATLRTWRTPPPSCRPSPKACSPAWPRDATRRPIADAAGPGGPHGRVRLGLGALRRRCARRR